MLTSRDVLSVFLSNVRSLHANHAKLLVFLRSLTIKPHVIVCTETWNLVLPQLYEIEGYRAFYNESRLNSADGVLMYIRKNLLGVEKKIVYMGNVTFLSITFNLTDSKTLTCTGVYRCHKIPILSFNESIRIILKKDKNKNHKIFGDFNIDISENNLINGNNDL